ncbi:aspartyl-phosphate phosphatase Spo0E family protein [Anaerobacillus sp. HL2]|nr:aspartyl-phosphate phosphatase Spo0E family protein [Anaerobacillus sp. HL2]
MQNCEQKDTMLEEIEIARKRMIELADKNPLHSKEVIDASTKLDKLLNYYDNMFTKRKVNKFVYC